MSHQRMKLLGAALLLFLAGAALGAAVMGARMHAKFHKFFARGPWAFKEIALEKLTRRLDLDQDQRVKMEVLLTKVQVRLVEVHQTQAPKIRAIIQDAATEGRTFLRSDQQQKLDELMQRVERRMRERENPQHEGAP